MLGFLPTRAYRPGTPGATTFLSPLSGTFNYGWDSFLHSGMMAHPFTGARIDASGVISFPVPDAPSGPVSHWYLLTWARERDGIVVAEDIWRAVELFLDELLAAFERAVPKRLRR